MVVPLGITCLLEWQRLTESFCSTGIQKNRIFGGFRPTAIAPQGDDGSIGCEPGLCTYPRVNQSMDFYVVLLRSVWRVRELSKAQL